MHILSIFRNVKEGASRERGGSVFAKKGKISLLVCVATTANLRLYSSISLIRQGLTDYSGFRTTTKSQTSKPTRSSITAISPEKIPGSSAMKKPHG